jgi:hypothetical protein
MRSIVQKRLEATYDIVYHGVVWRSARLSLGSAVLLVATAASAQTAQDLQTARDLFKQATELHDARDLKGALAKYKAAHELANTPVTGIELVRTYVELGLLTEAREVALGIDKIPIKPNESDKTKTARADAAALATSLYPRIASLTVIIDNAPAGVTASVAIDGDAVPSAAVGAALKLNPGAHVVIASIPGSQPTTTNVSLGEGEARTLHVTLELPPPPKPEPKPDPTPVPPQPVYTAPPAPAPQPPPPAFTLASKPASTTSSTLSTWAGISLGVGLGSVAFGALFGGLTLANKDKIDAHCNAFKQCDSTGLKATNESKGLATASTAFVVIGAVGVGASILLWVLSAVTHKENVHGARVMIAPSSEGIGLGATGVF